MMKKYSLLSIITFLIAGSSFAQSTGYKLVREVKQNTPGEIVIPFKEYKLDNGLTVLIHEDHSDPIVHVNVTYHVGSARELVGRSGFAHFFEHMMFQGSEHVADEEHFKTVTQSGGTLNGTTNLDRTNYFETMPSNYLETALWLEADRMGWFLDSVTIEKFEIQRATVKNERGQNYDNRPYGLVTEKTGEALYPFGHPYSWTTIGYIEDLNNATLDDLKNFFLRWYGPNNAVLTISGDVNPEKTIELVKLYFGNIPRGPEVKNMAKQMVQLPENRYFSYEDKVRFPMLRIVYPSVHQYHEDEAALDILANYIGGGKTGLMYQQLTKTQKILGGNAYNYCSELAGQFVISTSNFPGKSLKEIEQLLEEIITDIDKNGIPQDAIDRFKAETFANTIKSLQTVSGKASQLASYYTFVNDANFIRKDLERYNNVTQADVMRVFNKYIKGQNKLILSVIPADASNLLPQADNFVRPSVPADFKNDLSEYENLQYNKGKYPFEQNYRPSVGKAQDVTLPVYWTETFINNARIIGTNYTELPLIQLNISVKAGHVMSSPNKAGIANFLARMLNEDTKNHTAEELEKQLEKIGSTISIYASTEKITFSVLTLKNNLDTTLAILQEKMLHPKFDQEDFERIKKELLEGIENQKNSASTIANNVTRTILYGKNSLLGIPLSGTKESVENITLDDIKEFYGKYLSPSTMEISVVGSITKGETVRKLKFIDNLPAKYYALPTFSKAKEQTQTTIYFVDKKGAPQSEIRVVHNAMPFDIYGDYYKANIMNYILGGAFNSRLNLNLREKKGYTYGVRSGFTSENTYGYFMVSGGFIGKTTDSTIIEIISEIQNYVDNGITFDELDFTQNSIGQRDALNYESLGQKASFLNTILANGGDKNYNKKRKQILTQLGQFEINQLAKMYIRPDKMAIIIVGDKESLIEKIKQLGYPVVELDTNGHPIH